MEKIGRCQRDIISRIEKARIRFMNLQKEQLDKCYVETRLEILDRNWEMFTETYKSILDTITSVEVKASSYETELKQAEELYMRYRKQLQDVIFSFQSYENISKTSITDFCSNSSSQSEDFYYATKNNSELGNVNVYHNSVNSVCKSQLSSCTYCNSFSHNLGNCIQFLANDFDVRKHFVQTRKLCTNCLGANHSAHSCRHSFRCRLCQMKHHILLHPSISQSTNHHREVKQALVDKNVVEDASTGTHEQTNTTLLSTEKVVVLRDTQLEVTSSTEVIVEASHSVDKSVVEQATSAVPSNDESSQACISANHCQLSLTSVLVQAQSKSGSSKKELTTLLPKQKVVVLSNLPLNCNGVKFMMSSVTSNKGKLFLETRAQDSQTPSVSRSDQLLPTLKYTSSCKGITDKEINADIQEFAVISSLSAKRKQIYKAVLNKELNEHHGVSMVGGDSDFSILPTDGATDVFKKLSCKLRYSPQRVEVKKIAESDDVWCKFIVSVIASVLSVQTATVINFEPRQQHTEHRAKLIFFHRARIKKILLHGRLINRKCRSCFKEKFESSL